MAVRKILYITFARTLASDQISHISLIKATSEPGLFLFDIRSGSRRG